MNRHNQGGKLRTILIDHVRRYPQWTINDLYKLIHQAAMGPEHLLSDKAGLRDRLNQELAHLSAGREELLVDPISPDGRIVRVHLRPFVQFQFQPEPLIQAFILTAREVTPSVEHLSEYAEVAIHLGGEGTLPFSAGQLTSFMTAMQTKGFPAVHHSRIYRQLYQPAYRVVLKELLPKEINSDWSCISG
jgi:hypothetical protein